MNYKKKLERWTLLYFLFFLPASIHAQSSIEYDIVLTGGRVIDPETGVFVLKDGKTIANVFPGQAVFGKYKK